MARTTKGPSAQIAKFSVYPEFEKELMKRSEVETITRNAAEDVADQAKRNTYESIAEKIEVEVGMEGDSLVGRIVSKDFRSHWFEWGTVKMAAQPFLVSAATMLGYKVKGKRR